MELNELQQLSTWLKTSSMRSLELSRPGEHVKLTVSDAHHVDITDIARAGSPGAAAQQTSPETAVKTTTAGIFLATHPMRRAPFVTTGSNVRHGDVVGILKIGLIYAPVLATGSGLVKSLVASTGDLLGYGATVLVLSPAR